METLWNLFCQIFFNSTEILDIVLAALYMAGVWGLLQKSGLHSWQALIPGVREYQLARCAGREPEGRVPRNWMRC